MGGGDVAHALLILGMAGVTFLTRYLLIALVGRWQLPQALGRWLAYVPIAAFAVIVVRGTLAPQGEVTLDPRNPYLWGALAAGLVAWRSKNVILTVAAGLGGLWLARVAMGLCELLGG